MLVSLMLIPITLVYSMVPMQPTVLPLLNRKALLRKRLIVLASIVELKVAQKVVVPTLSGAQSLKLTEEIKIRGWLPLRIYK